MTRQYFRIIRNAAHARSAINTLFNADQPVHSVPYVGGLYRISTTDTEHNRKTLDDAATWDGQGERQLLPSEYQRIAKVHVDGPEHDEEVAADMDRAA